jgi:predicted transcriptional regulator
VLQQQPAQQRHARAEGESAQDVPRVVGTDVHPGKRQQRGSQAGEQAEAAVDQQLAGSYRAAHDSVVGGEGEVGGETGQAQQVRVSDVRPGLGEHVPERLAMSATQVLAELGGELAYTTVMTTLSRLHAKGVLNRQMSRRTYVYAVSGDPGNVEVSLAAHRMRRVLDSRQDRAGVLARFVADHSPEDEQILADLLAGHSGPRHEK